jgi:O-antigen/teichoic acid export membrane protein
LKNITNLINGFFKRAGSFVFLASITSRIASFLSHLIILRLVAKEELGVVIYAFSFVSFLFPMAGIGIQQSLVRYGALLKDKASKEALFLFTLKKGIKITIVLILLIIFISNYINFEFEKASFYFKLLSFSILTQFLLSVIKIQFRLQHRNKQFAYIEITYALLFLLITSVLAYFYQEIGYIISIIFTPLLVFLLFVRQLDINYSNKKPLHIINFSFWKYGFFAGLAYVTTLLLIEIDNILIGDLLMNSKKVTYYRYISLIPMSLLFLPRVLIATEFVYLTERISDKKYINNFVKSYFQMFIPISLLIFMVSYFFVDNILMIFGKEYLEFKTTFLTLVFGISGILVFRGLFGNLLSAIGKAHLNFIIAVIAIGINVVSNYYFIPKYGILGASITSSIIMWFTGIMTFILFKYNYSKTY